MPTIEFWIQIENRRWDASIDPMIGQAIKEMTGNDPEDVALTSPGTGASTTRKMFAPLRHIKIFNSKNRK